MLRSILSARASVAALLFVVIPNLSACLPPSSCANADLSCDPGALLLYAVCEDRVVDGTFFPCSPLSLSGTTSTFAGDGVAGYLDGVGLATRFRGLQGLASDGANLYVADGDNDRIRKIELSSRTVTTLAGDGVAGFLDGPGSTARFDQPGGMTTDGVSLFVADPNNHRIRRIDLATGVVSTFAGSGTSGYLDGPGASARFNAPRDLTIAGANLYVADQNGQRIRVVNLFSQEVSTLAGDGTSGFAEGVGTAARFGDPYGIVSAAGNLYVVDARNRRIRKVEIATGLVTTLAGTGVAGFADGEGDVAQFNEPDSQIATDGSYLYVADLFNHRIRRIDLTNGRVDTVAGNGNAGYVDGAGTAVEFEEPFGIASDGRALYVTEPAHVIRKIE